MSKFCKKCGRKLSDEAKFCTQCGQSCSKEGDAHVEEKFQEQRKTEEYPEEKEDIQKSNSGRNQKTEEQQPETNQEQESDQKPNKKSPKWKIPLIIAVCILCAACIGYFVIYPQVTAHIEQQKNEEVAEKVENLIKSVTGKELTLDSEKELEDAQKEYDSLTEEQKNYVSNYKKLEEMRAKLDSLKKVQKVIDQINAINGNKLTAEDKSVQTVRNAYNQLSEEEKKQVTNEKNLSKYEKIVKKKLKAKKEAEARARAKAREKAEKQKLVAATLSNLQEFEGWWGEFGAHVNKYQGMIEAAVKAKIKVGDYFDDANGTYMELSRQDDGYYLMFQGVAPGGVGMYRSLEGFVMPNSDKTGFYYVEGHYGQGDPSDWN